MPTPEVINAYAAVATLVATVLISIILHRGAKRIAQAEHERSMLLAKSEHERSKREWWNTLNQLALSSDEMLLVADALMNPSTATESLEAKRRKWYAFVALNTLSSSYMGAKDGLSRSTEDSLKIIAHHLRILLSQEDIYQLSQQAYEAEFAAFCRKVHAGLPPKPVAQTQRPSPPSTKIV